MTASHNAEFLTSKRLRFDRFVLDFDRGCLLLDENEIVLRPKTFRVLQFLIENYGRLVSKDQLFAAVWPDIAVTDDALVQSIGELRRALGEDGPRLIKTVPRRGYRFESLVSVDPSPIALKAASIGTVKLAESRLGGSQAGRVNGRYDDASRPNLRWLSIPC